MKRWFCAFLLIEMTMANSMYAPKRWYAPEWSGYFMVVLCSLVSVSYCASPPALSWMESMNLQQFCAVEKTALYNFHGITDFDDTFAVKLHRDATYTVPINIRYVDLTRNFDSLAFPLNSYMTSLRIFFSEFENFDGMWHNLINAPTPAAFTATVLDREYLVLSITGERILEASKAVSNGKYKQYANTLASSLKVISTIFNDTDHVFMEGITADTDAVSYDDYIRFYETRIEEEVNEVLQNSSLPLKYAKNVITLVRLYARDSLVPFINRELAKRNHNAIDTALASIALERPFGASTDLILITERHYENTTFLLPLSTADATLKHVVVSKVTRVLYGTDPDYNVSKMLTNYQGYGAYSIMKMECLNIPEVIPFLAEQFNITHTHCVTGKTYLNIYNTVIGGQIMSLTNPLIADPSKNHRDNDTPLASRVRKAPEGTSLEEIVTQSVQYERSLAYYSPAFSESPRQRVLSLGLGGGEIHMFLLNHFPTMEVTTGEISQEIFQSSQEQLGLKYGVCRGQRLVSNAGAEELVDIPVYDAAYVSANPDLECRSQVVIADAWDYIFYQTKAMEAATASDVDRHYYDFIIFDVYDLAATRWDGNSDGISSPHVDRASSDAALLAIRSLIRPATGLAAFHLHADRQFQSYYDQIVRIFGADQVVLFVVTSNDYMVVAGRNKYRIPPHLASSDSTSLCSATTSADGSSEVGTCITESTGVDVHPCEEPLNFTKLTTERNRLYGLSHRISRAALFSLKCVDKADYYQQV